jgi:hypothetical protein
VSMRSQLHPTRLIPALTLTTAVALAITLLRSVSVAETPESAARTWSPTVSMAPLSDPPLGSAPTLAMSGGTSVLGWTDTRNSLTDVYVNLTTGPNRSADQRANVTSPSVLVDPGAQPSVAIDATGRTFAAWQTDSDILLARFDATQNVWTQAAVVKNNSSWQDVGRAPSIAAADGGAVIVVWEDYRNAGQNQNTPVVYGRRCDGATLTCGAEILISSGGPGVAQRKPKVAARGATAVVVWEDHRERGAEFPRVYAAVSSNGGASWGANARVNRDDAGSLDPNTAASGSAPAAAVGPDGVPFVAWVNHANSYNDPGDVYVSRFVDGAWTWPGRIDAAPGRARALHVAVGSNDTGVMVSWTDYRSGASRPEIYAGHWNGAAWVESRVTRDNVAQTHPAMTGSGGSMRLAWVDERDGTPDIYSAWWDGSTWGAAYRAQDDSPRGSYQWAPELDFASGPVASMIDTRDGARRYWLARASATASTPAWQAIAPFPPEVSPITPPAITSEGGPIYAAWFDWIANDGLSLHVGSFSGEAWSEPTIVSQRGAGQAERIEPAIASLNNDLVVAWMQVGPNGANQVFVVVRRGGSWGQPIPLISAPVAGNWDARPSVAIDRNGVAYVAVGYGETNGRDRLHVFTRAPGAPGWTTRLVTGPALSEWCRQSNPQLTVGTDNRLHLIWSGCVLKNPPNAWPHQSFAMYSRSTDGGATWSTPVRLLELSASDDNDTSARTALTAGVGDEVLAVYPAKVNGVYQFFAQLIVGGVAQAPVQMSDNATGWIKPGEYNGVWHPGDGKGGVSFDPLRRRYTVVWPDRRNGRAPMLYSASFGDNDIEIKSIFVPVVRR